VKLDSRQNVLKEETSSKQLKKNAAQGPNVSRLGNVSMRTSEAMCFSLFRAQNWRVSLSPPCWCQHASVDRELWSRDDSPQLGGSVARATATLFFLATFGEGNAARHKVQLQHFWSLRSHKK